MLKRNRNRRSMDGGKLELSAMVDVVFLLLIFFIVTIQAEDILAELEVSSSAPSDIVEPDDAKPVLKIMVRPDNYYVNSTISSLEMIDESFKKIFRDTKTQNVIIICSVESTHSKLVGLLDLCAKHELEKIRLTSQ